MARSSGLIKGLEKMAQFAIAGDLPHPPGAHRRKVRVALQPTVLMEVRSGARILQEEVFGPVATVVSFSTEAEAAALANDTEFGLVTCAYTRNLNWGSWLSERLDLGMFELNAGMLPIPLPVRRR
jgi:acyl-CoA reductase-like NAD-dependent aldehyde dehydrogenase